MKYIQFHTCFICLLIHCTVLKKDKVVLIHSFYLLKRRFSVKLIPMIVFFKSYIALFKNSVEHTAGIVIGKKKLTLLYLYYLGFNRFNIHVLFNYFFH